PEAGRERLVREDDTPLRVEEPHSLSEALQERALHALTVSEGLLALLAGLDLTAQLGAQRERTATRVHDQPEPAREHELHEQRDGARGPPGLGARRELERVAAIDEHDGDDHDERSTQPQPCPRQDANSKPA